MKNTQTNVANGMIWFAPVGRTKKSPSETVSKKVIASPAMRLFQYNSKTSNKPTTQGIYINSSASKQLFDVLKNKDASVVVGASENKLVLQIHPNKFGFGIHAKYSNKHNKKGAPTSYHIPLTAEILAKLKSLGFDTSTSMPFSFEQDGSNIVAVRA